MEKEIIDFVADFTGTNKAVITLDTAVNDDLGVDGEDGYEFLLAFSERFDVDISNIQKTYFGPEGFNPLTIIFVALYAFISGLLGFPDKHSKLTVSQLITSAEKGIWVELSDKI